MEEKKFEEELKEQAKEMASKETEMTEQEKEQFMKAMEIAKMPVEFHDKDVVLGEGELDIRKLSKTNKDQMLFRLMAVQVSLNRQIAQMLVDVERLLMVLLTTNGIDATEIVNKMQDLVDTLSEQTKNENINKA